LSEGFKDYKYIYFPYPKNSSITVCVKKCPKSKDINSIKELDCKHNTVIANCSKSDRFEIYATNTLVSACIPTSDNVMKLIGS